MRHCHIQDMLDELLENPEEIIITAASKHCAFYGTTDGPLVFLHGDFSGTPQECEAEARRLLNTQSQKVVES